MNYDVKLIIDNIAYVSVLNNINFYKFIYLKENAAKDLGYKYEIWVYNKKEKYFVTSKGQKYSIKDLSIDNCLSLSSLHLLA